MRVTVIGAGLAGSEAAWQLAKRGISVTLCEMKPEKKTPAHETAYFAELCCSNSLRSDQLENAVGLLKEELRRLDSLILSCADATRVEAGGALAGDRHGFARLVTERIAGHPNITVVPGEVTEIPQGEVVIASGPLTSDALAERLQALLDRCGADAVKTQFGSCVFANRPGDGSAREQAASCQKVLGGFANICYAFATKRYRSNCINWGILPFTLEEGTAFPYEAGDCVFVPHIREAIQAGREDIPAKVLKADGGEADLLLHVRNLTAEEREIILDGCLMNYYAKRAD